MADFVSVPNVYATGTHWALSGIQILALNTDLVIMGVVPTPGRELIIDGVTVFYNNSAAVAKQVFIDVFPLEAVPIRVGQLDVPASVMITGTYYPLGIACPCDPTRRLLYLDVENAANPDAMYYSMWGHFVPGAQTEPAPVSVQEFHLFKPAQKRGPV